MTEAVTTFPPVDGVALTWIVFAAAMAKVDPATALHRSLRPPATPGRSATTVPIPRRLGKRNSAGPPPARGLAPEADRDLSWRL